MVAEALSRPRLSKVCSFLFFRYSCFRVGKGFSFMRGPLFFMIAFMFAPVFVPVAIAEELSSPSPEALSQYIFEHNRVHLSSKQAQNISREILRQSALLGVPVDLGVAIMERESSFNPYALNRRSGDYGLFQIHYSFWKKHFARKKGSRLWALSFKDLYLINVNVRVGMMIIRHDLVLAHGSVSGMIGFYSGRKGMERDQYVLSVLANESRFREYQKKWESLVQLR